VPADSVECVNIFLPDDSGYTGSGSIEYVLTCSPGPSMSWGDLTEQRVWTDENNTVLVPVCFSTFGRENGTCSDTFTISISAPSEGISKTFMGGVCVSGYRDVDTNPPQPGQDPGDVLNNNVDIFAMAFTTPTIYATPGEQVVWNLNIESYADVIIDLSVQTTTLSVTPAQSSVSLSDSLPRKQINYTVQAPGQAGTYDFNITGTIRGCSSGFCSRKVKGRLIVTDTPPQQTGFSVSIFPENINVEELEPVSYQFMIHNRGTERTFSVEMNVPEGIQTTFVPQNITVGADTDSTIMFSVTPANVSSFYVITLSAKHVNITKQATAYLSTNEMLTDAARAADRVTGSTTDQRIINDVNSAVDNWYNNYRNSNYGENLEEYSNLQHTLNSAGQHSGNHTQNQTVQDQGSPSQDTGQQPQGMDLFGKDLWILIAVIAAIVAVLLFIVFKKTKSAAEVEYY